MIMNHKHDEENVLKERQKMKKKKLSTHAVSAFNRKNITKYTQAHT